MRLPIQVLVYPMCSGPQGSRVLLLRRTAKLGGFWQGVTGAPEPGESLGDAAARELCEETGLAGHTIEQIDFSYSFSVPIEFAHLYARDVERIDEFVFIARLEEERAPSLSHEHKDWRWCSVDDALKMLKWADNKRALIRCDAVFSKHG